MLGPIARTHMTEPAIIASAPVSRAMRAPEGPTRSAVIAAVITSIMRASMMPVTKRTAIGAAQLRPQSRPSPDPSPNADMTLLLTVLGAAQA
jgi:hypothetical protein